MIVYKKLASYIKEIISDIQRQTIDEISANLIQKLFML